MRDYALGPPRPRLPAVHVTPVKALAPVKALHPKMVAHAEAVKQAHATLSQRQPGFSTLPSVTRFRAVQAHIRASKGGYAGA